MSSVQGVLPAFTRLRARAFLSVGFLPFHLFRPSVDAHMALVGSTFAKKVRARVAAAAHHTTPQRQPCCPRTGDPDARGPAQDHRLVSHPPVTARAVCGSGTQAAPPGRVPTRDVAQEAAATGRVRRERCEQRAPAPCAVACQVDSPRARLACQDGGSCRTRRWPRAGCTHSGGSTCASACCPKRSLPPARPAHLA